MDAVLDQKICAYLEAHRADMVADLQRLVRIPSYREAPLPDAPFGPGPARALEEALAICAGYGLSVCNVDHYAGYAQWGESAEHVASLAHLDTVPIGDGWVHDPVGGAYEDGIVYGRGVADDKGGVIASLYAVRALMAAGFVPKMAIRLIFGCDEECGMSDMPHYLAREKAPKYAFSPDAGFPLFYAEKGRIDGRVTAPLAGPTVLKSVQGGVAANVVPADAWATLSGVKAEDLPAGEFIDLTRQGADVTVHASGISCHGGAPRGGRNAAALLYNYLARALPEGDGAKPALEAFARLIGMNLGGEGLGLACTDEVSGEMTMSIGIIGLEEAGLWFHFDIRHPVTLDEGATAEKLRAILAENGWQLPASHISKPLYMPLDSPLVTTLMGVYRDITGDSTPPATMGGGTYARTLPCAVSFGHGFPGDNSRGHTYEENLHIDQLVKATRIYAHALAQLSQLED